MLTSKLLIVDDNSDIRHLLSIALGYGKYALLQAANGAEAIDIAREEKPAVIVLDVMMPGGMDGLEVCRTIRSTMGQNDCYIVMLSAKGQQADIDACLQAGANHYLVKPFNPSRLVEVIENRETGGWTGPGADHKTSRSH